MLPPGHGRGRELDYVMLDIDAALIEVHSEEEQASAHSRGGFGMHPILCFLDNTDEALAGILRTARAGQQHRGRPRSRPGPRAGGTSRGRPGPADPGPHRRRRFSHAFLDHLLALGLEYSVGYAVTDDIREAIAPPVVSVLVSVRLRSPCSSVFTQSGPTGHDRRRTSADTSRGIS